MSKAAYVLKMSTAGAVAALALSYGAAVALDGIGMTPARSPADAEADVPPGDQAGSPIATGSLGDPRPDQTYRQPDPGAEPSPVGEIATPDPDSDEPSSLVDFGAGLAKTGALTMPPAEAAELAPPEPASSPDPAPAALPLPPSPLRNVELLDVAKPASPSLPEERIIEIGPKRPAPVAAAAPEAAPKAKKKSRKSAKSRKRKTSDPVLSFFGMD